MINRDPSIAIERIQLLRRLRAQLEIVREVLSIEYFKKLLGQLHARLNKIFGGTRRKDLQHRPADEALLRRIAGCYGRPDGKKQIVHLVRLCSNIIHEETGIVMPHV